MFCGALWRFVVFCGGLWCLLPPVLDATNQVSLKLVHKFQSRLY